MQRLFIQSSRVFFNCLKHAKVWFYPPIKQCAVLVTFFLSLACKAESLILFDIVQQRADKAIIAFAQQTNQTIIFSFDLAKEHQTNRLKGYYSIRSGLEQLLAGTELNAVIEDSGQLSITYQQHTKPFATELNLPLPSLLNRVNKVVSDQAQAVEQITIIGSRVSGRLAEDLPVPVDIFSAQVLANTGQTEVGRMLQAVAPSFNFSSSAISDGTDALRPATLRGLGPDQTLVLINGKRRHQASLIHINTSVGRGTTGTDMNAVPASAIKRIEVLRDGAAAQYGSDAIAGVINIVLNDKPQGGKITLSTGEYFKGDGQTTKIDLSKGFALGLQGYLNSTLSLRERSPTNRSGLQGSCLFVGCKLLANGNFLLGDPREASASRSTFRIGDANSEQMSMTFTAGYEFKLGKLSSFVTYSSRENESAGFFRNNNNTNDNAPLQDGDATIPEGFLPKINTEIKDISYNLAFKTDFENGSIFSLSYTYGENNIDYVTSDTINSSFANSLRYGVSGLSASGIRASIPRSAFAYGLALTLQTFNADYTQDFNFFSLALGGEFRTDEYRVIPGDEYSYRDYDSVEGNRLFIDDRSPGTQGFGGISPISAVNESREVFSLYLDVEMELFNNFILSTAVRYDDYYGFSDNTNIKLAANWSITDDIALRSAISTGFRAPSMQQLYFNNISTQFVSDPTQPTGDQIALQVGTFRNDSTLAQEIGIPQLKEEASTNYSFGLVYHATKKMNINLDFYAIKITDRIVISNKLGAGLSLPLDAALEVANVAAGQFFLNGSDTETFGVDMIATWKTQVLGGNIDITFAANATQTEVVKLFTPPNSRLKDIAPEHIFSEQDISIIEEWQPESRISVSTLYKQDSWSFNLAFNRYGEYTITDGGRQTYGAELLTDIRMNYQYSSDISFNIGANNLFNVMPDINQIGNSRAGTIEDADGNILVSSSGVFTYSRRSAPFGFNGSYYYAGVEYRFQ